MKDEQWEVLHRKALGTIQMFLDLSMAFNISKEKITYGMMSAFGKLYEKPWLPTRYF